MRKKNIQSNFWILTTKYSAKFLNAETLKMRTFTMSHVADMSQV